ncbi:MAG: sigma-E processing peptidase SpoIIGA [Clostridia bacterium]|nr:sigma-E processing peptidase SpoIIGA [Clostridia bacterium]MBR3810446.1 sigma-E processing peptidase SpoIIGA [Clostridia bacterium]
MVMVIYLDVLIAVNIFVTYILIVCTRVIVKQDTKKWGMMFATIFGGAASLIIFWEEMPLAFSIIYKILVGVIISYSAFLPREKKMFLKTTLAFFFVNFIFGGVMYFVEITIGTNNLMYINGTVYFDVSVLFLVSMTLICYGLLLVGDYFFKKRASENTLYDVLLYFRNESVSLKALYDTGNHLTDGLDSKPVIIVELKELLKFLNSNEIEFFMSGNLSDNVPETIKSAFRVIPCSSVTGNCVLKGFIPEKIEIITKDYKYETTFLVVAVSREGIQSGEYNCILNADIFERGKRIDKIKVNR